VGQTAAAQQNAGCLVCSPISHEYLKDGEMLLRLMRDCNTAHSTFGFLPPVAHQAASSGDFRAVFACSAINSNITLHMQAAIVPLDSMVSEPLWRPLKVGSQSERGSRGGRIEFDWSMEPRVIAY